jgi:hypothetical protein
MLPIGNTPPPEEGWRDGPYLNARETHREAGHKGQWSACPACMPVAATLPDVVFRGGLGSGWGDCGLLR